MAAEVKLIFDVNFSSVTDNVRNKVKDIVNNNTKKMGQLAQDNVEGPHPVKLEVDTGNLLETIVRQTTITEDENSIIGEVGSDAQSYKGFPYAAYWEGAIPQGDGKHSPWPRPFLQPALDGTKSGFLEEMENLV